MEIKYIVTIMTILIFAVAGYASTISISNTGVSVSSYSNEFKCGNSTDYLNLASDGELSLIGTARVKKTSWIDAGALKAPGAKPATFVESGLAGSWEFGDEIEANQEHIAGIWKIPADLDRTEAVTMKVHWYANGVSPGNCTWQLEYLWIGLGEDETAAAQETLSVNSTASAISNGMVNAQFTGIDLPDASDSGFFFRITRLSGSASDTIAANVYLRGRAMVYYADKLGQSI